jgi:mannose-6-phosphate isomerase-like protein (cupin superfamily)
MAKVHLGPSQTFRFEAGACQEILVFVEKGSARLGLTLLEAGRAARFHAPALLQGMSDDETVIFAVAALSEEAPSDQVDWGWAPSDPSCPTQSKHVTVSDRARSGPFVHAEGRLSVMIYLDGLQDGPAVASLGTLSGDPTLGVPKHIHERSAEVLWIQNGSGTMRVGNETHTIRPGTFVHVPPQTVHGFQPDGSRPLFAYQVYTPSGPEQRFR